MFEFRIALVLIFSSLVGCASTPPGKSMERGHYADMASTGIAFAANSATKELNPLGWALIPIKASLSMLLEKKNCPEDAALAKRSNTITYAVSANNLAVAASLSAAPVVGIAAGAAYWLWVAPNHDAIQCEAPDEIQTLIAEYVDAYNAKDHQRIGALFTETASTPNAEMRSHIQWTYEQVFSEHPDYEIYLDRLWWIRDEEYIADFRDKEGNWHNFGFTADSGLIASASL